MGQTAEAREALEKAIEIAPGALDTFVRGAPAIRPDDQAHILEGPRKAGWRE
jgi:adenylate cyclase